MFKVTKDMVITDVLMLDDGLIPVFFENGLYCIGCMMASGETIEEACMVHGMDLDHLLHEINVYLNGADYEEREAREAEEAEKQADESSAEI